MLNIISFAWRFSTQLKQSLLSAQTFTNSLAQDFHQNGNKLINEKDTHLFDQILKLRLQYPQLLFEAKPWFVAYIAQSNMDQYFKTIRSSNHNYQTAIKEIINNAGHCKLQQHLNLLAGVMTNFRNKEYYDLIKLQLPTITQIKSIPELKAMALISRQLQLNNDEKLFDSLATIIKHDVDCYWTLASDDIPLIINKINFDKIPSIQAQIDSLTNSVYKEEAETFIIDIIIQIVSKASPHHNLQQFKFKFNNIDQIQMMYKKVLQPYLIECELNVDRLVKDILKYPIDKLESVLEGVKGKHEELIFEVIQQLKLLQTQDAQMKILVLLASFRIITEETYLEQNYLNCQKLDKVSLKQLFKLNYSLQKSNQLKLLTIFENTLATEQVDAPESILLYLNQIYIQNIGPRNNEIIYHILKQIDLHNLNPISFNRVLFIVLRSKQFKYFKEYLQQIEQYIQMANYMNNDQLVSIFFQLSNLLSVSVPYKKDSILQPLTIELEKRLNQLNPKQLGLIIKGGLFANKRHLEEPLKEQILKGQLDGNLEGLLNYTSNKIKLQQQIAPNAEIIKYTLNQVEQTPQLSPKEYAEFCHLIVLLGKHSYAIPIDDLLRFKDIQKINPNQLYYVFAANVLTENMNKQMLEQITSRLSQIRAFQQARFYQLIVQAQLQSQYAQIYSHIVNSLVQPKALYTFTNVIDNGLLTSQVFTSACDDNPRLFNNLIMIYSNEIRSLLKQLQDTPQFARKKLYNTDQQQLATSLNLRQLYQAQLFERANFKQNSFEIGSQLISKLENTKSIKNETVDSVFSNTLEMVLKKLNYEYIAEYAKVIPFSIDFFIPALNLGIECNGEQHYLLNKMKRSDQLRQEVTQFYYKKQIQQIIEEQGIKLLNIRVSEWNSVPHLEKEAWLLKQINDITTQMK